MSKNPSSALLILFAASGCHGFVDPSFKGSLFDTDRLAIPAEYRGEWAARNVSCYTTAAADAHVQIGETNINNFGLVSVQGYSDHPAIVVKIRTRKNDPFLDLENDTVLVYLDISQDGKRLKMSRGFGHKAVLLRRCIARAEVEGLLNTHSKKQPHLDSPHLPL